MSDGDKTRIDWRYTRTRRKNFLRVLAETYDVEAALTAGKLTWPQVCELRVRHPEFAVRFEEVIAAGYDRLEAALLRRAGAALGAEAADKGDAALATALLKQRRALKDAAPAARRAGGAQPASDKGATQRRMELIRPIMGEFTSLQAQVRGKGGGDGAQGSAAGGGTSGRRHAGLAKAGPGRRGGGAAGRNGRGAAGAAAAPPG